jgi:hypothetical protein
MNGYDVMELVKEYQIAERDCSLTFAEYVMAKERRDRAKKELGQYLYDVESVAAPDLGGEMILYFVDEGGEFQARHIGKVLTAGEGGK